MEFTRSMFNSTFKTNPWLERAVMTGITRVSKESIFSDLNNLEVVTTTSNKYATAFGFTEEEVFSALEDCGLESEKEKVKYWYDGFVFGSHREIYNPWSALNFLDKRKYGTYWANSSSNSLVGKLIREGNRRMFYYMVHDWFIEVEGDYNDFVNALLRGDVEEMNAYMNRVALQTFRYFDTGRNPAEAPERFYHGFAFEGKEVLIG